ncbi:MAG: tetratricopeptide repeat protein [Elusimicrobiota bacterium]
MAIKILRVSSVIFLICVITICSYISRERVKVWGDSIKLWNSSFKNNPDIFFVYKHRGYAYIERGEYDKAIADLSYAIKIMPEYAARYSNPNNPAFFNREQVSVYYTLGDAYFYNNEYNKAIECYDKAIEVAATKYPEVYNNRGIAYAKKGQYGIAMKNFDTAIKLDPVYAEAHTNRGYTLSVQGRNLDAIKDYDRALAINPGYYDAYANRAKAYFTIGEYGKAKGDIEILIEAGYKVDQQFLMLIREKVEETDWGVH